MTLSTADIATLARRLDNAQTTCTDTASLADTHALDIADAYAVQEALLALRCGRGEHIAGVKLGFTSKAKMAQMGVSEVILGRLTDTMRIADGGEVNLDTFVHPKVEPEVAFLIGHDVDLDDPTVDLQASVTAVAAAVEIIDSRYRDFRFTYTDVVADNTSAAGFAIGPWQSFPTVAHRAVAHRAVRLRTGNSPQVVGSTSAILGDPVRALPALLAVCRKQRIPLRAGYVVLAGAATAAVPLLEGVTECQIASLGSVWLKGLS